MEIESEEPIFDETITEMVLILLSSFRTMDAILNLISITKSFVRKTEELIKHFKLWFTPFLMNASLIETFSNIYAYPFYLLSEAIAYSGDTRSAIPVIPVHSVVDFQYRRQN